MGPFTGISRLDMAIDGADQVDPSGWLVKGGGGAHTRGEDRGGRGRPVRGDRLVEQGGPAGGASGSARAVGVRARRDLRSLGRRAVVRHAPATPTGVSGRLPRRVRGSGCSPQIGRHRLGIVGHGLFPPMMVALVLVGDGDRVETLEPLRDR